MIVLPSRCATSYVISGNMLEVVEIRSDRVLLGVTPVAGQTVDLREEENTEKLVRELRCVEGDFRLLVWVKPGDRFRINHCARVQIISLSADEVSLGISDLGECKLPAHESATSPVEAGKRSVPVELSCEILADWVSRKITTHLKGQKRGAVQELASKLGVSAVTINRWKKRETVVTRANLEKLLEVLHVSRDELARELGVDRMIHPDGRARSSA